MAQFSLPSSLSPSSLPPQLPFVHQGIKVWPCFSKPSLRWFAAINGKAHYFTSAAEAKAFINAHSSIVD